MDKVFQVTTPYILHAITHGTKATENPVVKYICTNETGSDIRGTKAKQSFALAKTKF